MGKTSIEWTDHSINPIRARDKISGAVGHYCEKISSGCANCYASKLQKRFQMPGFGGVKERVPDDIEIFLDESKLQAVMKRKKPTRYFWCDMTDMFGPWVSDTWLDKCFATMALTPQHTHQVLTKRPGRAAECMSDSFLWQRIHEAIKGMLGYDNPKRIAINSADIPLPNVWIGTSVENQEQADKRIPELLKVPAAVRFLSVEPLLGPVDLSRQWWLGDGDEEWCGINWVIVGGESGHGARPMHPQWVRSIRDQCVAAGVPFFFKQFGEWGPAPWRIQISASDYEQADEQQLADFRKYSEANGATHVITESGRIHQPTHKPWSMERVGEQPGAIRRWGKKAAGRILDGREWSEFPN